MGPTEQALADLLEELRSLDVADADLRTALGHYFPLSRSEGDRSVDYFRDGEVALSAAYRRDGLIRELLPGPWLSEGKLDDLRQSLRRSLLTPVSRITRSVQFGLLPCTGAWRYRDRFQILPVPPEAPQPPQLLTNQPFVLEVRYDGVEDPIENPMLEIRRADEAVTEVGLVLAGLLPRIYFTPASGSASAWGIELGTGEAHRSKWVQLGYTFPGFNIRANDFTDASGLPSPRFIDVGEFYGRRGISLDDQAIDLPDDLEHPLDAFFALSPDDSKRFLHWCFWLNHAKQAGPLARSAAHIAVVQAIEALMPRAEDSGRCPTCGQAHGPGPTARFADFLREFAPSEDQEGDQERGHKELYSLRSALTHGGKLLQEELFGRGADLHPQQIHEDAVLGRARSLTQVAGVNWLMSRAPESGLPPSA